MARDSNALRLGLSAGFIGIGCVWPILVIGFWGLVVAALWKYVFGG